MNHGRFFKTATPQLMAMMGSPYSTPIHDGKFLGIIPNFSPISGWWISELLRFAQSLLAETHSLASSKTFSWRLTWEGGSLGEAPGLSTGNWSAQWPVAFRGYKALEKWICLRNWDQVRPLNSQVWLWKNHPPIHSFLFCRVQHASTFVCGQISEAT